MFILIRSMIIDTEIFKIIITSIKNVFSGMISSRTIFMIIVLVQFLVITKGAERVAEVAARFTLDAMPGKQMAIDADLGSLGIPGTASRIARTPPVSIIALGCAINCLVISRFRLSSATARVTRTD